MPELRPPDFEFHILGIAGFMRSGKDTIADRLVLRYGFIKSRFAGILYWLWSCCEGTFGEGATDRRCKLVHDALADFAANAGSSIPYDDIVCLTHEIVSFFEEECLPLLEEAPGRARRIFLQEIGVEGPLGSHPDLGRSSIISYTMYEARQRLMERHSWLEREFDRMMEKGLTPQEISLPQPRLIFSDVRYPEEVEAINAWSGKVFLLQERPGILAQRRLESGDAGRDTHATEQAVERISLDVFKLGVTSIFPAEGKGRLPEPVEAWLEEHEVLPLPAYSNWEGDEKGKKEDAFIHH